MKFALVFSSLVAAALAQTINTPESVLACANHQVTFTGGVAPYTILVVPGGDTSAAALETFQNVGCSPFTWFVDLAAGTSVFLRLQDSAGASVSTAPFTIQASASGNATCTAPASTSQASCAASATLTSGGGATSAAGGATTTPAATGGSGSSTPAAGGGSSSHATSTSASASSTHTGAAFSNQVGIAGAVVGFVAMGLAALA